MSHASLSECAGANESFGMPSNYLVRCGDLLVGVLFMGQRTNDSDVRKKAGSTLEIMNCRWRDEIAVKAGLLSFEEFRLDT